MVRNPEYVRHFAAEVVGFFDPGNAEVNERYRAIRQPEDPETYAEHIARTGHPVGRTSAITMQTLIDSPLMGKHLNRMRWSVVRFNVSRTLLTSDRPIVMTGGLIKPTDHLALPIGPRTLFVAANTEQTEHLIRSWKPADLVEHVNDRVASQARKYVWGRDDTHLRFVANRLGKMEPSTPLDPA
jgi:hypothetical protein